MKMVGFVLTVFLALCLLVVASITPSDPPEVLAFKLRAAVFAEDIDAIRSILSEDALVCTYTTHNGQHPFAIPLSRDFATRLAALLGETRDTLCTNTLTLHILLQHLYNIRLQKFYTQLVTEEKPMTELIEELLTETATAMKDETVQKAALLNMLLDQELFRGDSNVDVDETSKGCDGSDSEDEDSNAGENDIEEEFLDEIANTIEKHLVLMENRGMLGFNGRLR